LAEAKQSQPRSPRRFRETTLGETIEIGDAVGTEAIADDALGDAVGMEALADDVLGMGTIADDALGMGALADDALGMEALAGDALGMDALADDALPDDALGLGALADDALGMEALPDDALGMEELADELADDEVAAAVGVGVADLTTATAVWKLFRSSSLVIHIGRHPKSSVARSSVVHTTSTRLAACLARFSLSAARPRGKPRAPTMRHRTK
jgi:hypothetical protein